MGQEPDESPSHPPSPSQAPPIQPAAPHYGPHGDLVEFTLTEPLLCDDHSSSIDDQSKINKASPHAQPHHRSNISRGSEPGTSGFMPTRSPTTSIRKGKGKGDGKGKMVPGHSPAGTTVKAPLKEAAKAVINDRTPAVPLNKLSHYPPWYAPHSAPDAPDDPDAPAQDQVGRICSPAQASAVTVAVPYGDSPPAMGQSSHRVEAPTPASRRGRSSVGPEKDDRQLDGQE